MKGNQRQTKKYKNCEEKSKLSGRSNPLCVYNK